LDEQVFDTLRIAPFDDTKVREYVTKWFAADLELTNQQKEEKSHAFLRESNTVPDLRTNPLMLALMCNIYRGENYIPRNRLDVYEKCALMLFEKWDKSRGINVPLPFEAHVRPAMMYLAHWVFSDEHLQGGVSEHALIAKCTEYLCPRRYEDVDHAGQATAEFIEFCRGRAWVFTDTGTTKDGERLYQFTHRTFLEYFTAAHLVRTHATPELLGAALLPKIAAREWDVVAQLAFQLQNKNVEGAGDSLIASLLENARRRNQESERPNMLSFAARALEFLVPSPALTREIVSACMNETIQFYTGFCQKTHKLACGMNDAG
jgi:predicted NACHT family NTPase